MSDGVFFFGDWQIDAKANSLRLGLRVKQIEPKAMDVLVLLCQHAGDVVTSEELLSQCWPGIDTGDNPLHKTINQLRSALGDKASSPIYIETIRKRGYRALAEVRFPVGHEKQHEEAAWQGRSPFPGLSAFSSDYAQVFFGRSQQIATLMERISQQVRFGRGFCLVLGPSGSGKSSLINAGILANLTSPRGYNGIGLPSAASLDLADVGKEGLILDLASTLLDWELADAPVLENESADSLANKLLTDPQAVISRLKAALPKAPYATPRFGLFIDRLEVALSSPLFSEAERDQFIALLETLALSGAVLVLSACRNDFYPELMRYDSLRAGKGNGAHFDLGPPSRVELLQMIRLPAKAAGLEWQTDPDTAQPLDEILCLDAARNPDALPMLQYMLEQLYLQREGNLLKVSVYQALGGIEGAIGQAAEDALAQLSPAQQQALPRVLSLLVTLREDEESITSRSACWADLKNPDETALVQAMVDKRLFVSHLQHGEASFSVAHEALLRRWPRATAWIDDHKDSLTLKARLFYQAERWQHEGKANAYLLALGKPLQEAKALAQNPLFSLGESESAFIKASSRRATWRRGLRNGTIALLCLLTTLSVAMSIRSHTAERHATTQRLAAENMLGYMVGQFSDKLRGIGRMDLLDGISSKALDYFKSVASTDRGTIGFDGRFQHGQTLEAIGEVAYSRGKTDEAKNALMAAQKEFLPLLKEQPKNLDLLKSLGANAFWLGQMRYDVADWSGAEKWFKKYLVFSQKMYDIEPSNVDSQAELAYAFSSVGSIAMKLQKFDVAVTNFEQSLNLKEKILERTKKDPKTLADIINTKSWIASASASLGDVEKSISILENSATYYSESKKINNAFFFYVLSSSMENLALLYENTGAIKKAKGYFIKSLELNSLSLKLDQGNSIWKEDSLRIKLELMNLKTKENKNLKKSDALEIKNKINNVAINKKDKERLLGLYFMYRANKEINSGNLKTAEKYINKSISAFDDINKKISYHPEEYAMSLILKASILFKTKEKESAIKYCNIALNTLKYQVVKDKDPKKVRPYKIAKQCVKSNLLTM
ncbi:nSTAND1 domain-containing NTPase [Gallaecimonas mangrovi]|uniref:nSTAND1 domain-containing NTPase n=1 Tax=Gallaecimonas mangrovi TaxID=2291597 RepID=UPI000E1FF383|nr:winged helix-turn-helix domain-containing protein [Gallaecimonas mangrovi]